MSSDDLALAADVENFVLDNADLERLEALLDEFNPFAAMRWVRQEVRHSCFLRWALDPTETHGLGPHILRRLLKHVAHAARGRQSAPSLVDLDCWDLSKVVVITEWNAIDIVIRSDQNQFVAVFENKVDSAEHSDQLKRYRELIERQYPTYSKLFVYLTIEGEEPSDDEYTTLSYGDLAGLLGDAATQKESQINRSVYRFILDYVQMVRRYIVDDSDIQRLCERIYAKHQRALDTIFEYRPDRAQQVASSIRRLIAELPGLVEDYSSKGYIRFTSEALDKVPRASVGWTRSQRILLCEITNLNNRVSLKIVLGPGETTIRDRIHAAIVANPAVFNRWKEKLYPKFWSCHVEAWMDAKEYSELELAEIETKLRGRLTQFVVERLPRIEVALKEVAVKG